jgi:hypothetical protein
MKCFEQQNWRMFFGDVRYDVLLIFRFLAKNVYQRNKKAKLNSLVSLSLTKISLDISPYS